MRELGVNHYFQLSGLGKCVDSIPSVRSSGKRRQEEDELSFRLGVLVGQPGRDVCRADSK